MKNIIDRIDHIVLTVADLEATIDFYTRYLGMTLETFGQGRIALKFGRQKLNLHQVGQEFEPKAKLPTPGAIDLCFITRYPLNEVESSLRNAGVEIIEGPVERTGGRREDNLDLPKRS